MTDTIPAWIKKGALALFTFTNQVVEIQGIEGDELVAVRRARSTGNLKVLPSQLKPATIEQVIDFALDAQRINEIKSIQPHGKEENRFRVQFLGHISPATIDRMNAIVPEVFLDAELDGDAYIVTVKPSWLEAIVTVDPVTPAMLAQAEAEAAALKSQVVATVEAAPVDILDAAALVAEQAEVEDEELAETARIIRELRERNDKLQARNEALAEQVDSLIQHIDGIEQQAEAVTERETSLSTGHLTGCKQVVTLKQSLSQPEKSAASDNELADHLNNGYEILDITIWSRISPEALHDHHTRFVTLVRNQPAPAPTNGHRASAKLIESTSPAFSFTVPAQVYADSRQPVPSVNQATTPPRNFASIAQDRTRLQAMLNDPDTTQFDFSLAVEKSNLSRDERNSFISSFRTHHTGEVLAAHMAAAPRPSGHNPFKSLNEGARS